MNFSRYYREAFDPNIKIKLYDITIKNNTDTGNVKIRIFTPDTIDECELERMKVMQLNEVQKLVRSSYKGTVTILL